MYLFAAPEEMQGDAATNYKRWQQASGTLQFVRNAEDLQNVKPTLESADIIIDALLGTGTRGAVEGLFAEAIEAVNKRRGPVRSAVVAVDIPSGLVADTGEAMGACINAMYTITFTAPKIGMIFGAAGDHTGQLIVREIGSPPELIEEVGKSNVRWIDWREVSIFARPRRADAQQRKLRSRADRGGVGWQKRCGGAGVVGGFAGGRGTGDGGDARAGVADCRGAYAGNNDRAASGDGCRQHFAAQFRIRAL